MLKRVSLLVVAFALGGAVSAQNPPSWTQLSLDTCNVNAFLAANPASDGRGVVIAVLDTGVDPSIPGLTQTPDGEVKVIDVQDFSGEGDTDLHRVRLDPEDGTLINHADDGAAIHYTLPALAPGKEGNERIYWFGTLNEKKFVNASVPDLNDNGQTDDVFAICVTALEGDGDDDALCFVDTNVDRSFADEKPLRNYKLDFDTFVFHRARPEEQIAPLTFAVNIFLRKSKVVFHFDDGAHGTHVAGIAAGYRINDQDGFNGVAPGAKVISLKIGQNAVGGISTTDSVKKAMEYAARFGREHGMSVVCNMSYGVESTIEGNSDIDRFMDKHLRKNPELIFCTSAGNEGPGLSSMGTPSCSVEALSVGAVLAAESGRDVQGYSMEGPVVTVFSSRGGEAAKPDIITPGWSTSTVPRYVDRGDYWSGTSMASPYAAGLCALALSDAITRHPKIGIRAWDVKQALRLSATPLPDTTVLDGGYGLPDVVKAAAILNRLVERADGDPVIGYDISTPCPHGYKGVAPAAYWRGTYFPSDDRQTFSITPVFAPGVDAAAISAFTRKFELRSQTSWCKVPQESFYLQREQTARVYVEYDAAQLTEPGRHVGVVDVLWEGEVAFRLINTVVVPHRLTTAENFTRRFGKQAVRGWDVDRYFLAVPPGASAMQLTLSVPDDQVSKASIERIFDPYGFQHRGRSQKLDTDSGTRSVTWSFTDDLTPGVWEAVIVADRPDKTWPYDLDVRFFGLWAEPAVIDKVDSADKPSGALTITNLFERPLRTTADGEIEGFREHAEDKFKGLNDVVSHTIKLEAAYSAVRLDIEMTPKAWAEATDIGVAIMDEDGKDVYSSAFDNNTFSATIAHPKPGADVTLKLEIRAGFAISDDKRETAITVNIDRLLAAPVSIKVTRDDSPELNFVPGVPIGLEFEASDTLPKAPDGAQPVGFLRFRQQGGKETALRVPIQIK